MQSWNIFLNVLLFLTWHGAESDSPSMTLYSDQNEAGTFFTTYDAQSDLDTVGFDDMADSVCGVGLWFLYENNEFGDNSDFVHIFANHEYACENLDPFMTDQVSSLRYPGIEDIDYDTLTLYQYESMCGGEFLVLRDISQLDTFDDITTSLAVTGNSSWTIYEDNEYSGGATCIVPTDFDGWYYGVWDVDQLSFPDNTVSSVRKGCHTSNVYAYQSTEINQELE